MPEKKKTKPPHSCSMGDLFRDFEVSVIERMASLDERVNSLDQRSDRIETGVDRISGMLISIDKTMAVNTGSLQEHMEQTNILRQQLQFEREKFEEQIQILKEEYTKGRESFVSHLVEVAKGTESRLKPIEEHVKSLQSFGRGSLTVVGWIFKGGAPLAFLAAFGRSIWNWALQTWHLFF